MLTVEEDVSEDDRLRGLGLNEERGLLLVQTYLASNVVDHSSVARVVTVGPVNTSSRVIHDLDTRAARISGSFVCEAPGSESVAAYV